MERCVAESVSFWDSEIKLQITLIVYHPSIHFDTFCFGIDPPKLTMFIDGKLTSGPLPLPSVSTFVIKCLAEGARPKVSIRFQVDGHEWLTPTFQNTTIRNMLFDTIATVHLNSSDNLNGSIVTCQTVGQDIIPHINESQTLCK